MTITAYPLAWPAGWPRTRNDLRTRGWQFKEGGGTFNPGRRLVTFDSAKRKLKDELARLLASNVIISTNLPLRQDGEPRSDAARYKMFNPGVAVYFTLKGKTMVMACDRYDGPAANLRSVGLAVEAMRQLERHGGGAMMERAFTGFEALPGPRSCWDVLGVKPSASEDEIKAAFRTKAMEAHPDGGGTHDAMTELNRARDEALEATA